MRAMSTMREKAITLVSACSESARLIVRKALLTVGVPKRQAAPQPRLHPYPSVQRYFPQSCSASSPLRSRIRLSCQLSFRAPLVAGQNPSIIAKKFQRRTKPPLKSREIHKSKVGVVDHITLIAYSCPRFAWIGTMTRKGTEMCKVARPLTAGMMREMEGFGPGHPRIGGDPRKYVVQLNPDTKAAKASILFRGHVTIMSHDPISFGIQANQNFN